MSRARELAELSAAYDTGGDLGNRNYIINGCFRVAQRGNVSVDQSAVKYGGADRTPAYPNYGGGGSATLARTAVTWTASGYAQGFTNASATGAGSVLFLQKIEALNSASMAGKEITVSLKLAHDYGSSCNAVLRISRPTTTSDGFGSLTTLVSDTTIGVVPTGTSSGTYLTFTTPVLSASDVSKGVQINISINTGATYSSKNFYIGDFQVESGKVATPFQMRQYGVELALCQRYFSKSYDTDTSPGGGGFAGIIGRAGVTGANTASEIFWNPTWRVTMRAAPTCTLWDHNGNIGKVTRTNFGVADNDNQSYNIPSINTNGAQVNSAGGASACNISFHYTASAEL